MLFGSQPFIADMTSLALSRPSKVSINMKKAYQRRAELVYNGLSDLKQIRPLMPNAGMFILIDISQTSLDCSKFSWRLLQEYNVAVMPGSSFGDQAKNFIRISLTVPDKELISAVDRISAFTKDL